MGKVSRGLTMCFLWVIAVVIALECQQKMLKNPRLSEVVNSIVLSITIKDVNFIRCVNY